MAEAMVDHKEAKESCVNGTINLLGLSMIIFMIVSISGTNASANLQGKQNLAKLPYDDALIYVVDENGDSEYRIYDLNAYRALKKYSPSLEYNGEYYVGEGEKKDIEVVISSKAVSNVLNINKADEYSLIYLEFLNINATSFIIDDGKTSTTYEFNKESTYSITIHSNCSIILVGGSASLSYQEVIRDYAPLIPESYQNDKNQLHFNLWLTNNYNLY